MTTESQRERGHSTSRIALVPWAIGGWMWGATSWRRIERGVTLIDTAAHGFGRSEEIVGKVLAEGGRRSHVLIATKVGVGSEAWLALLRRQDAHSSKRLKDFAQALH